MDYSLFSVIVEVLKACYFRMYVFGTAEKLPADATPQSWGRVSPPSLSMRAFCSSINFLL